MSKGYNQQVRAAIHHYRSQLLAREQSAVHSLEHAYAHTLHAIQPNLDHILRQIAEKHAAGEDVPLSWLYESNRLKSINQLIESQVNHYGQLAQMSVGQLQHQAVQLGQQAALAGLRSTLPAGANWTFGIPSPSAIINMVGMTRDGAPLVKLFAGFGEEAAKKASQALMFGVTNGSNPRVVAALLDRALNVPRWRALTIARTEMLRAYRSANIATMRANSDVVEKWRWEAAPGACPICIDMDGTVHDLDEEMDSHPNCRCVPVPVTKSWSDILSGLDESDLEEAS